MIKLVCFDMDGTVYLGNKLIDGAKEVFKYLKNHDINFVFITNNSSKNIQDYIDKVNNLGIICEEDNFFSSVDVTKLYLKEHGYKKIYVLGTKSLISELSKVCEIENEYHENSIDCLVAGFDRELTFEKLCIATKYLEDGVPYIATHPDFRCPTTKNRYEPDCGAMCHLLEDTTGRKPLVLGKPEPTMINCLIKKYDVEPSEVLVVGDRLYTDILSGINAHTKTLAVLTGEITMDDINNSDIRPTYVLSSIAEIYSVLDK